MSKIHNAFDNENAFIGFLTAGDPSIEKTVEFIKIMINSGVDLIEIGIPFSDPVAEGPVIQNANVRALSKGINTDNVFEIVKEVRYYSDIPLVFLTYINPVFYYGYDLFFSRCEELGIDGIIVPDLPFDEKNEIFDFAYSHNVDIISMIAPTSKKRIEMISKEASGFIYVVSSLGVTGMRSEIKTDLNSIISIIKNVSNVPTAVGFGINTPEQAENISKISDGVIVGSAIVKIIEEHKENAGYYIGEYVKSMKQAVLKGQNK